MAKKRPPEATPHPETPGQKKRVQITLDPDIARDAGMIASDLLITLSEWVNNRLAPIIAEELPEVFRRRGFHRQP